MVLHNLSCAHFGVENFCLDTHKIISGCAMYVGLLVNRDRLWELLKKEGLLYILYPKDLLIFAYWKSALKKYILT